MHGPSNKMYSRLDVAVEAGALLCSNPLLNDHQPREGITSGWKRRTWLTQSNGGKTNRRIAPYFLLSPAMSTCGEVGWPRNGQNTACFRGAAASGGGGGNDALGDGLVLSYIRRCLSVRHSTPCRQGVRFAGNQQVPRRLRNPASRTGKGSRGRYRGEEGRGRRAR